MLRSPLSEHSKPFSTAASRSKRNGIRATSIGVLQFASVCVPPPLVTKPFVMQKSVMNLTNALPYRRGSSSRGRPRLTNGSQVAPSAELALLRAVWSPISMAIGVCATDRFVVRRRFGHGASGGAIARRLVAILPRPIADSRALQTGEGDGFLRAAFFFFACSLLLGLAFRAPAFGGT